MDCTAKDKATLYEKEGTMRTQIRVYIRASIQVTMGLYEYLFEDIEFNKQMDPIVIYSTS
jgi:hypothetical protein